MEFLSQHRMQKLREAAKTIEMFLARDEDDTLVLSVKRPVKDKDFGWINGKANEYLFLPDHLFHEIKADEKEPRKVILTLQ